MQDELLPPWLKYPNIPRCSIGWRMGNGEGYRYQWFQWWKSQAQAEQVAYLHRYLPIPFDWLDWVAHAFGFDFADSAPDSNGEFRGIRWMDEQGLTNFAEFNKWRDEQFRARKK